MARKGYTTIIVEIYEATQTGGKHGRLHIRPAEGQPFPQTLDVECDASLTERYPAGALLRMDVRLKYWKDGGEHLYSSWRWEPEEVPSVGG